MDASVTQSAHTPARSGSEMIGRVAAVSGSQATVELSARSVGGEHPTVGKFMGMLSGKAVIIGLVTDVGEQAMVAPAGGPAYRKIARLDLIGEIRANATGAARFQRGDDEFADYGSSLDAAPLQPAAPVPVPPSPRGEALRSSLLKKPLEASSFGNPQAGKRCLPPRFR